MNSLICSKLSTVAGDELVVDDADVEVEVEVVVWCVLVVVGVVCRCVVDCWVLDVVVGVV